MKEEFRAMLGDSMLTRFIALAPGARTVAFTKFGARLHAMVTSAGYDRCTDPAYDWHGLRRGDAPYVLLQHTLSGRGQLRFGGQVHVLRPGQTMLLQFPHDHRYWLARGDTWEFFWICLNGREVLRIWRDAMAASGPVASFDSAAIERLAGLTHAIMQGEGSTPARALRIAYAAAMEVADALLPWGAQASAGRPEAVRRAVSLVQTRGNERGFAGRVDVAALAAAAGYSRYHFTRIFTESEGVSPARYLLQQRLEEAVAALRTSPSPIKTIALRCGFTDANYFSKAFRRAFGMSPRAFRATGMLEPTPPRSSSSLTRYGSSRVGDARLRLGMLALLQLVDRARTLVLRSRIGDANHAASVWGSGVMPSRQREYRRCVADLDIAADPVGQLRLTGNAATRRGRTSTKRC